MAVRIRDLRRALRSENLLRDRTRVSAVFHDGVVDGMVPHVHDRLAPRLHHRLSARLTETLRSDARGVILGALTEVT